MAKLYDNYLNQIIRDLKLQKVSEKEQAEALAILQDRLDSVVLQTLVALSSPKQKQLLTQALEKNQNVEETIADVSSQIPQFSEALEQAMLAEYQSIRDAMS